MELPAVPAATWTVLNVPADLAGQPLAAMRQRLTELTTQPEGQWSLLPVRAERPRVGTGQVAVRFAAGVARKVIPSVAAGMAERPQDGPLWAVLAVQAVGAPMMAVSEQMPDGRSNGPVTIVVGAVPAAGAPLRWPGPGVGEVPDVVRQHVTDYMRRLKVVPKPGYTSEQVAAGLTAVIQHTASSGSDLPSTEVLTAGMTHLAPYQPAVVYTAELPTVDVHDLARQWTALAGQVTGPPELRVSVPTVIRATTDRRRAALRGGDVLVRITSSRGYESGGLLAGLPGLEAGYGAAGILLAAEQEFAVRWVGPDPDDPTGTRTLLHLQEVPGAGGFEFPWWPAVAAPPAAALALSGPVERDTNSTPAVEDKATRADPSMATPAEVGGSASSDDSTTDDTTDTTDTTAYPVAVPAPMVTVLDAALSAPVAAPPTNPPMVLLDSGVVRIGRAAFYFPAHPLTAQDLATPDATLRAAMRWAKLKSTVIITHHDHLVDVIKFNGVHYSHQQFAELLPTLDLPAGMTIFLVDCTAGKSLEEGGVDLGDAIRTTTGTAVLAPEELLWQTRDGVYLRKLRRDDDGQPVLSTPTADDPETELSRLVYYPADPALPRQHMTGDLKSVFRQVMAEGDAELLADMRVAEPVAWLDTTSTAG